MTTLFMDLVRARLSPDELETLKKSPGFLSSYADRLIVLSYLLPLSPLIEFLSLNNFYGLWPTTNYGDREDIIIGIIDSGLWPENLSFKDDGPTTEAPAKWRGSCEEGQAFNSSMCNKKLIGSS